MPRKDERKTPLKDDVWHFLGLAFSYFMENKDNIAKKLGDIVNFKKMIRRYVITFALVLAALFVILDGIGMFISSFFPGISPGLFHILIGILIVIVLVAYNRD
jgi:hypothetical protein